MHYSGPPPTFIPVKKISIYAPVEYASAIANHSHFSHTPCLIIYTPCLIIYTPCLIIYAPLPNQLAIPIVTKWNFIWCLFSQAPSACRILCYTDV